MKCSIKKGLSFGLTSGIITTLGLVVGLNSTTHSTMVVIGGIMVIAIADALSDALGIHISEEAEEKHTVREVWEATIYTFLSKFLFASMFVVPFLLFSLDFAIKTSVIAGLLLIVAFSFVMARRQKINPYAVAAEHLAIAILVIAATHLVGDWVAGLT